MLGSLSRKALLLVSASALVLVSPLAAIAAGVYPMNATGFDVSYPECGSSTVPNGVFALVGVTDGKAFTQNPCFSRQYDQSVTATTSPVSLYMNLNAAIGSTASEGRSGPAGSCARSDKSCVAYNYGYNAAQSAVTYAGTRTANTWWLDIETANSWNAQNSLNQRTIQGAVDGLKAARITYIGVYSSASMWNSITGGWSNGLPVWYAGTSSTTCSNVSAFTGGTLWLVQQVSGASDGDLGC